MAPAGMAARRKNRIGSNWTNEGRVSFGAHAPSPGATPVSSDHVVLLLLVACVNAWKKHTAIHRSPGCLARQAVRAQQLESLQQRRPTMSMVGSKSMAVFFSIPFP